MSLPPPVLAVYQVMRIARRHHHVRSTRYLETFRALRAASHTGFAVSDQHGNGNPAWGGKGIVGLLFVEALFMLGSFRLISETIRKKS